LNSTHLHALITSFLVLSLWMPRHAVAAQRPNTTHHAKTANTEDGFTPLIVAALQGNATSVKSLIARGANLDARDNKGNTALITAVAHDNITCMQVLINVHANLNLLNNDGASALSSAVLAGITPAVKALIVAGANLDEPAEYGDYSMTPLHLQPLPMILNA